MNVQNYYVQILNPDRQKEDIEMEIESPSNLMRHASHRSLAIELNMEIDEDEYDKPFDND